MIPGQETRVKESILARKKQRYSEEITIDEQKIKEILVAIKEPRCPFEVSMIKEMFIKRHRGSYASGTYSYN